MFLWISQNSLESTSARASFLIKMQAETWNFIKIEALGQVFSCEFWEIFKNTFFTRHLRSTAIAFFVCYRQTSVFFLCFIDLRCFVRFDIIRTIQKTYGGVLTLVKLQVSTSLLKVTLLHECFSHFLNCANGTKASHFFIPTW